jgi:hypothetical protein
MLRIIHLHYSGTLLLPNGEKDPFGPWQCIARKHTRGYQAYLGGATPYLYHPTLAEAVKEAAESALCAPVANLRVVEV